MLNWNEISDHNTYNQERFELLTLVEGSTKSPYVDGVGVPTIGIGFNLRVDDNLEAVLRVIVGKGNWSSTLFSRLEAQIDKDYGAGRNSALIANLDKVMADWHDRHDSDVPRSFAFRSDAQIAKALDAIAPRYDGYIENWISDIPESSERAALFSLTWNAPSLLGPKLKAAIEGGDRAEAWYEIRYNSLSSSLPSNLKPAIANRRYVEADQFDLYHNDGRASWKEAVDAGNMLAVHHESVLGYEAAYNPLTAASVKGVETITVIYEELQPAIVTVLKKLDLPVGRRVEELLAAGDGIVNVAGDGTARDSARNDDDLLLGDSKGNRLTGGAGQDVLVGLRGADTLTGNAGADLFVFASAADSGSAGARDLITDFGTGSDRIALRPADIDFHLLAARNANFSGEAGEIRWLWSGGKTLVQADYDGDGQADLTVALNGKLSLSSDDFLL